MASPKKTQKSEEKLSAKKSHANEHRRLLDKARAGWFEKWQGWVEMFLDATHVVGIVSAGFQVLDMKPIISKYRFVYLYIYILYIVIVSPQNDPL